MTTLLPVQSESPKLESLSDVRVVLLWLIRCVARLITVAREGPRVRVDTAANWAAADPILAAGEPGYESDTHVFKIGDGVTQWSLLTAI